MLTQELEKEGMKVKQADEDADRFIVNTAISQTSDYDNVVIVSEDIGLIYSSKHKNIFFNKPGRHNKAGS